MKYRRFEDLPVWQEAAELARRMYEFTSLEPFRRHPGLRDQLERAALSVSNNIAEGFERGTTNELLGFLYIARGSSGEVQSMLRVLEGWRAFGDLKSQISDLRERAALRLDREPKEFRNFRPAPPRRKEKGNLHGQKRPGSLSGRAPPHHRIRRRAKEKAQSS